MAAEQALYDGHTAEDLAQRLGLSRVAVHASTGSTMDEAHALAAGGAVAGTLVVADTQQAGRGRNGKRWSSPSKGIWMTLIERPDHADALQVLSIRVGLGIARALDAFVAEPVRLKWPNDLYVEGGKLAGTLVEARWRGDALDWIAIGIGVNTSLPEEQRRAAALEPGTLRVNALAAMIGEIRAAVVARGLLTQAELEEYAGRDMARGRACSEPVRGTVAGIAETGELLVDLADARVRVRSGSLLLD